ncbi:hypothetical protein [Spirosoma areae]
MQAKLIHRLLNFALFGLSLWFFGNLYEEIILMPNWLAAPLDVLKAYNRYYSVVIQYHYYVPITQLAVSVLTLLAFRSDPILHVSKPALRRAVVWGWLGIALTAWIVLTLNLDLFIGQLTLTETEAHRKGLVWMIGNAVRLGCVGMALIHTIRVRDQVLSANAVSVA